MIYSQWPGRSQVHISVLSRSDNISLIPFSFISAHFVCNEETLTVRIRIGFQEKYRLTKNKENQLLRC